MTSSRDLLPEMEFAAGGRTRPDASRAAPTSSARRLPHPSLKAALLVSVTLATAIAIVLAAIVAARADVVITGNRGGDLKHFEAWVWSLHSSGERVVIDGPCESACTLVLTLPRSQLCATARGSFGFHSVMDGQFGWPVPAANEQLLRSYPQDVRDFIVRRGGLWINVIRVKATQFVRACR